jgi:low temperature requirement protein LtrA
MAVCHHIHMPEKPESRRGLGHALARMTGRDPGEGHRASTPLELLFDLTFVIAIGQASGQLADLIAEGHVAAGFAGFSFAMFAICWAWINFSWFASAYDTDDWFYRVTTMVQMIGVLVLALGLPAVFHSIDTGAPLDNRVVVAGYVVMRVAMIAQWLRAAHDDPGRRRTALGYVVCIGIAQIGWIATAVFELPLIVFVVVGPILYLIELGGPLFSERRYGWTPWHPHHIAERYQLLTIITLGEVLLGTVNSVSVIVQKQGWSTDAVMLMVAGTGLTLGLWWCYAILPSGPVLAKFRQRAWLWGYAHMIVFASVAAMGAGLHVAGFSVEGTSDIGAVGTVLTVAIPVLIFSVLLFGLYSYLIRELDRLHVWLFAGCVVVLALAVMLALAGATLGLCLIVVMLAPAVVVVGFETIGHRHEAEALGRQLTE